MTNQVKIKAGARSEACCMCGKLVCPRRAKMGEVLNNCDVCGGYFCKAHGGLVHGSRDNINGQEVLVCGDVGKWFFVCTGCRRYRVPPSRGEVGVGGLLDSNQQGAES